MLSEKHSNSDLKSKGVTAVVGLLIILALLTASAARYQIEVIPMQEEQTEIDHNRLVRQQMSEIRNDILGTSSTGDLRTQQVQLGTQFKSRVIFGIFPAINQPSPSGTLEYIESANQMKVKNAEGLSGAPSY